MIIVEESAFELIVNDLEKVNPIALDTEADSRFSYPEQLCLIQLTYNKRDILIDPLAELNLKMLAPAIQNKEIILHAGKYDLQLLKSSVSAIPSRIFDTMLAARFIGCKKYGLSDLTEKFLGIKLNKFYQKANWSKRPLSPALIEYAKNDTRYLEPLANILKEKLIKLGRLDWHIESCNELLNTIKNSSSRNIENEWRIKGCEKLSPKGLAVLRKLWQWREEEALRLNRPPYFVLPHSILIQIAKATEDNNSTDCLLHLLNGKLSISHELQTEILQKIKEALSEPETLWPKLPQNRVKRFSRDEHHQFIDLLRKRDRIAKRLGIEPGFIIGRTTLAAMIRNEDSVNLMGWQKQLLFGDNH